MKSTNLRLVFIKFNLGGGEHSVKLIDRIHISAFTLSPSYQLALFIAANNVKQLPRNIKIYSTLSL